MRKQQQLQPGQQARLLVDASHRSVIEPLLVANPSILTDSFLTVDDATWAKLPETEIELDGEVILLGLEPLN